MVNVGVLAPLIEAIESLSEINGLPGLLEYIH